MSTPAPTTSHPPEGGPPPPGARGMVALRRAFFFGTVLVLSVAATGMMADWLWRMGMHRAHPLLLGVYGLLITLLTLGSMHALVGAVLASLPQRKAVRITALADGQTGTLTRRYAVVMPVYNEDPVRTGARIEAIYRSISATGQLPAFDFFILSDTTQLDVWIEEEVAWVNLCRKLNAFGRLYYRRRKINENRKAGNIGDFVRTWGGLYEGMLVLDADSLMDGADIVRMARILEAYPRLGILQTPPRLIRGASVFTRMQQFAMSLYGPFFTRGLNFWQLGSGSYWGHNALIRILPFSAFCELPALPGREPFGGRILSHDFVEAALMVREGWEVWLAWDVAGTYEESPPTLVDHLIRDRRWCQGNLQHLWLLFARKLPLPVRAHLFMGIMAYLGSPLLALFLLLGMWVSWDRSSSGLTNIPVQGFGGKWFHWDPAEQGVVLAVWTFGLLLVPKVLAWLGTMVRGKLRRSYGGGIKLTAGVLIETLTSILLAPTVMVSHTAMVLSMLVGRSVKWANQTRETDGTGWGAAVRMYGPATLIGLAAAAMSWQVGRSFFLWMSPICLGLVLAIPVAVWTSRTRYGRALARRGLLNTPEELDPPEVIRLADAALATTPGTLSATRPQREGIVAAVVDPYVNGVHISLLGPYQDDNPATELLEQWLGEGPTALGKDDLVKVLYDAPTMLAMHRALWARPFDRLHARWVRALESYRLRTDAEPAA